MKLLTNLTSAQRLRLYLIGSAVLALLVGYKMLDSAHLPLWLDLLGAVLGVTATSAAAANLHQQRKDGTL